MDDRVWGRGGGRECAESFCGLRWFCTHIGTKDGIETTFFALHPNLLIGHLLHPIRSRPLIGSVDIHQCFQIPAPSSLFTSSLRLFYIIHLSSSDLHPCLRFKALPRTPSTTDDENSLPSPQFNPHRAAIRPLVIAKHNTVGAPFLRHSSSRSRAPSKYPSRSPPHPHADNGFTNLDTGGRIRLRMVQQRILQNSHPPFSPPHDTKPLTPRINIRPSLLNPVLETTPTHAFLLTLPCLPSCWRTTNTKLPTTARSKARPLFVYFFLPYLSFHDVDHLSRP